MIFKLKYILSLEKSVEKKAAEKKFPEKKNNLFEHAKYLTKLSSFGVQI